MEREREREKEREKMTLSSSTNEPRLSGYSCCKNGWMDSLARGAKESVQEMNVVRPGGRRQR